MPNQKPSRTPFGARLDELIDALGYRRRTAEFAASVGVGTEHISRMKSGKQRPSDTLLIAICCVHGVHRDWLERGEGPMRPPEAVAGPLKVSGELDLGLLRLVLEGVEEGLEKVARVMPPGKKAELVAALYEMYAEQEVEPDKEKILRLIVSAA